METDELLVPQSWRYAASFRRASGRLHGRG
jgi:hypothetical protein